MKYEYGKPPASGDSFIVTFINNDIKEIFYCPQQGWIDKEWNPISIDDVIKYYRI